MLNLVIYCNNKIFRLSEMGIVRYLLLLPKTFIVEISLSLTSSNDKFISSVTLIPVSYKILNMTSSFNPFLYFDLVYSI